MDKLAQIALTLTPGLGPTSLRRLLEVFPGADIFALPPAELRSAFGRHEEVARHIINRTAFARAEQELAFCQKHGIRPLFCTEADFPQRLNRPETEDCPALLYVLGRAGLNPDRSVAIVGTRRATPQGRDATATLVKQLSDMKPPIVSGLAYGIDTAAHTAALEHQLPTVAVLGHGLDRIYPPENRRLAEQIVADGGALVSEYPSGTPVNPRQFPARNRIIAALADAVVVVEASEKGGALITANIAAGYHREVFAVPGRLTDTYSKGTNALIAASKALLLRSADDMAYHMGWPQQQTAPEAKQTTLFGTFSPDEQQVIDLLRQHDQLSLDEIAHHARLTMPQAAAVLFNLEMNQAVHCLPGHRYQIKAH